MVKIEVNGTKRGIIGDTVDMSLCDKTKEEFSMGCKARTVSFTQLYGGKIIRQSYIDNIERYLGK